MFHFKQFSILHQTQGLKVNTDGCLLGALSKYDNPSNCLDIGTGTGVIALMLAQKYPNSKVTAIELNTEAYNQAQLNIKASIFSSRIELINQDILQLEAINQFDLIVCNPPYFTKHLKGPSLNKNMALHNDTLPQESLINKVSDLLAEAGIFMVIYPVFEMEQFKKLALQNGLFPQITYNIQNKVDKAYRTIIGFGKMKVEATESTLVLIDEVGNRTTSFSELMFPFYL